MANGPQFRGKMKPRGIQPTTRHPPLVGIRADAEAGLSANPQLLLPLASVTGFPPETVPCVRALRQQFLQKGSLVLGFLEGVARASLEPSPLNWKQSTLVPIQVGYLWQRPFHSWGNHTCMDGHLYELSHVPVRTSNHVIQRDKGMNGQFSSR